MLTPLSVKFFSGKASECKQRYHFPPRDNAVGSCLGSYEQALGAQRLVCGFKIKLNSKLIG